jgi:hypothetical protein
VSTPATPIPELIARLTHTDPQVRRIALMDLTRAATDPAARAALLAAYLDPTTPARAAHAAILAHDGSVARERVSSLC